MSKAPQREPSVPGARTAALRDRVERNVFVVLGLSICVTVHTQLLRRDVVGDAWYTLLGGRSIERSGLPHHDVWTVWTLGRTWVDQQWLAQWGFYGLWAAGGWRLALLSVALLFLASFALLALTARRLGASDRAVGLSVATCYLVALDNSALRAQIPAYLLFALVLALLVADARAPSRRVLLVFPVLALWANVHGSVLLGAGLVALRGATVLAGGLRTRDARGDWLARGAALIVLPWACALVSPYGLGIVHYYRSVLGNAELQHVVSEWAPTTLRSDPVFFALLLVAMWLMSRSPGETTWFERLALAGAGLLGLDAGRYMVWFALVAAVVLPAALDAAWPERAAPRHATLNVSLAGAGLIVALGACAATALHGDRWFERDYPSQAEAVVASAARADRSLRVFANEKYADWLMFADPLLEGHVAYDVRFELLSDEQLGRLVAFDDESGAEWRQAVRGYGLLVLNPSSDGETISLLEQRRGATVRFRSGAVVVLEERSGTGSP